MPSVLCWIQDIRSPFFKNSFKAENGVKELLSELKEEYRNTESHAEAAVRSRIARGDSQPTIEKLMMQTCASLIDITAIEGSETKLLESYLTVAFV